MKRIALFILLPLAAYACINIEGNPPDEKIHRSRGLDAAQLRQAMAEKPSEQTVAKKFGRIDTLSEAGKVEAKAIDKLLWGETRLALEMFQSVEAKWPGRYTTAANLGTAYELCHDPENALKWINRGIQLNGQSHGGTEWLHALILKSKVEAEKHPDQPMTARLLNLPEVMQEETPITVDGLVRPAHEVADALYYQLHERMLFVKPKDYYVAELLYSFALIQANLESAESAMDLLKLAREYGFKDEALLKQREQQFQAAIAKKAAGRKR